MIKVIPSLKPRGIVRVGDTCEFKIIKQDSSVETRSVIKDQNIFYLKPLTDWNFDDQIHFTPETPGKYILTINWRSANGLKGWIEQPIEVVPDVRMTHTPQLITMEDSIRLWVPSEWEANLLSGYYDTSTIGLFPQIIKPGWIIYDVGASLGLYSIQFSRLVGQDGHVYCIEANPICVYFLRANLEMNGVSNCEIFPVALLDDRKDTPFTIIYGNSNIGLSLKSSYYQSKIGQEIMIQGFGFDELIDAYNLKPPNMVKIDIEGAEDCAVRGMEKTISRHNPLIFLEIHGKEAGEKTLPLLEPEGYRYQVVSKNKEEFLNTKEFLNWLPNTVLQVICFPPEKRTQRRSFFSK